MKNQCTIIKSVHLTFCVISFFLLNFIIIIEYLFLIFFSQYFLFKFINFIFFYKKYCAVIVIIIVITARRNILYHLNVYISIYKCKEKRNFNFGNLNELKDGNI